MVHEEDEIMENRLDVLGVGIDKVTSQQALEKIGEFIASGQPHQIVTANAEIIYQASKNEKMRNCKIQNSVQLE